MCVNQFIESMRRIYWKGLVSVDKINDLCKHGKISEKEKAYILSE